MAAKKNLPVSKTQYNKLVKQCLQLISDYKILFVTDLIALLPFSKSTFYVYGLDKSDAVKEAIENNKTMIKQQLKEIEKANEKKQTQNCINFLNGIKKML